MVAQRAGVADADMPPALQRWNHHLRPDIKKDAWTEEEEAQLVEAHKELGNKWSDIARLLPGERSSSCQKLPPRLSTWWWRRHDSNNEKSEVGKVAWLLGNARDADVKRVLLVELSLHRPIACIPICAHTSAISR